MIIKMSLDETVERRFYIVLIISLSIYIIMTIWLMIKTRANYLMDNIKHSYTESFDSYDLSDGY